MGRRFGQHFLVRESILERIASAACEEGCETVIEIGPGRGALTAHLLRHAARVAAIEIDPVLAQYLRAKFAHDARFQLVEDDVLKVRLDAWGPAAVAGNLPYYITSPIVQRVLQMGPMLRRAVFLVQKEVADRMTASPGTRDYGYLSVQTQLLAEAEALFEVSRSAFRPPPKVESALIRLNPRAHAAVGDPAAFLEFAGLCFRQKRKTLRNNLSGAYGKQLLDGLPEAGMRAEQLSVAQLANVFEYLRARRAEDG